MAYRGAIPIERVAELDVHLTDVVVHVGPCRHLSPGRGSIREFSGGIPNISAIVGIR